MAVQNTAANLFRSNARQAQAPVQGQTNGNQNERPQSQEWVNNGRVLVSCDPDTGEITPMFVGLPFGIGVDTMSPAKGTGMLAQEKNALLDEVREVFKSIQPGEEVILGLDQAKIPPLQPGEQAMLDGLFIQLRRVHDEESRKQANKGNPFLAAMAANRLTVVK